jgi:uncharacterized protein YbjT (DUF2867 family)
MNKRILVTGGRGTLGKLLVPRLLDAEWTVRISSRSPRPGERDPDLEWSQASLESASGWSDAVRDVDTIVHAASAPFKRNVDNKGTRYLLDAAEQAGVRQIVYISIVGVEEQDWFYYRSKYECEKMIADSSLPYSILRATQFHEFADLLLREMFLRGPIGVLPRGWRIQPIDGGEVAGRLFDAVQHGPGGYLPEAGGPEILTFKELAETWMETNGRRRTITLPFPFLMHAAFSTGHNLAPQSRNGRITWREWVTKNHAEPSTMPAA